MKLSLIDAAVRFSAWLMWKPRGRTQPIEWLFRLYFRFVEWRRKVAFETVEAHIARLPEPDERHTPQRMTTKEWQKRHVNTSN